MLHVQKAIELAIRLNQNPERQAELMTLAAFGGPTVLATGAYGRAGSDTLLLVTTDTEQTARVLGAAGFQFLAHTVVLCGPLDSAGDAAHLGRALSAAGIGMLYAYSSRFEGRPGYVVFKTTDDERAVRVATQCSLAVPAGREHERHLQAQAA